MPLRPLPLFALAFAFLMPCATPAGAADSPAASHPCARVADPDARLVCYDQAFPPAPEVVEAAASRGEREFGMPARDRSAGAPAVVGRDAGPDSIEAAVVAVQHGARQERVFTLDNGQVWAQTESRSSGPVAVGDRIRVRKAAFGTHMLVTAGNVGLRVKRIR